jgi:hypothetical protein
VECSSKHEETGHMVEPEAKNSKTHHYMPNVFDAGVEVYYWSHHVGSPESKLPHKRSHGWSHLSYSHQYLKKPNKNTYVNTHRMAR